jgi:hypothetical protein
MRGRLPPAIKGSGTARRGTLEISKRDLSARVDREHVGKPCEVCDTGNQWLFRRDDEDELLIARLNLSRCVGEQSDYPSVDERAAAEIDEHVGLRDALLKGGAEHLLRAEVVFSADVDKGKAEGVPDLDTSRLRLSVAALLGRFVFEQRHRLSKLRQFLMELPDDP